MTLSLTFRKPRAAAIHFSRSRFTFSVHVSLFTFTFHDSLSLFTAAIHFSRSRFTFSVHVSLFTFTFHDSLSLFTVALTLARRLSDTLQARRHVLLFAYIYTLRLVSSRRLEGHAHKNFAGLIWRTEKI